MYDLQPAKKRQRPWLYVLMVIAIAAGVISIPFVYLAFMVVAAFLKGFLGM